MYLVLKVALVYLCLLYRSVLHGSCSSTCSCVETCTNSSADEATMPCLFHADHSSLTAGRLPNEAVCSNYGIFADPLTQEPFCEFTGTSDSIVDICQSGGSLCLVQNPNQKTQSCQKDHYYCNYMLECPPNQLLWVQCTSMDLPHVDNNDECMDEVTMVSSFIPNGKRSHCGSTCYTVPEIIPFSMEINYGASHCCHNYGFVLSSFCSSTLPPPSKKKRAVTTDPCLTERIIVVPMDGSVEYSNRTIRVIIPSQRKTLTYKDIQLLFIEDKRHGNSIYTDTGLDALHGYGELEVVGYVAYYRFYTIDPSLIPNEEETAFITKSVNMLTDLVSKTTYNSFGTEPTEKVIYDMAELYQAKEDADARKLSSNPFVSGIAKDLLVAVDSLLTDETSATSSKAPYSRQ